MRATIPIRTRGPKPVCEPATAVSSVVVVPAPSITTLEEMPTIGSTDVAPEIAEEAVVTHPSKDKEKRQVDHGGNLGPLLSLLYENVIGDKIKGAKILHEESACMGRGEGGMSVALDSKAPCMQIDDSLVVVPTEDSRAKVFAFSAECSGSLFAWYNKMEGVEAIIERLDCFVGSWGWSHLFPCSSVSNLDLWRSDHHPVLLNISESTR
ncbi:hypothetical protein ACOSQ2_002077 [Xanthoceras sorbifolium]